MVTITSQPFPSDKIYGEEMTGFLEDVGQYATHELVNLRKLAFLHMQLKRFTREELKLLVGHTDYLIKQRSKND